MSNIIKFLMKKAAAPPPSGFIFDIQTTGASETFSLPLEESGTYGFNVDWGDNSDDDITAWNQGEVTHTYASAGTYEIKITGTIIGWRFNYSGDYNKIYEIKSWGPLRLGNNGGYFYGCSNLTITATDVLDLAGTTDLESLFDGCSSLTTVPSMNEWDMSSVISMRYLFYDACLFNQDIGSWDVSSVVDMYNTFYGACLFDQDISSWNVSSVVTMYGMFVDASTFDQDIGSWDITSVTDMASMFWASALSTANYDALLIGWEAQAVQNNVAFHGGNSKYSADAAATARQALIDDHFWTIQDGGQV